MKEEIVFSKLIMDFAMYCRTKTVDALMARNDIACFNREQYRLMYIKIIDKDTASILGVEGEKEKVLDNHFASLLNVGYIKEVRPGVYTKELR